jgi:hypothetical protein
MKAFSETLLQKVGGSRSRLVPSRDSPCDISPGLHVTPCVDVMLFLASIMNTYGLEYSTNVLVQQTLKEAASSMGAMPFEESGPGAPTNSFNSFNSSRLQRFMHCARLTSYGLPRRELHHKTGSAVRVVRVVRILESFLVLPLQLGPNVIGPSHSTSACRSRARRQLSSTTVPWTRHLLPRTQRQHPLLPTTNKL